ncbi:MAG: UDP-N-acetylglucosamine 1-carboxyvinyltransferase [Symbiobacteriaceae bacterium]|nr:MAG: UDP-N-acetylglucosamine 1-carboxyvinyltransferase [Bacillota bacterium]
MERIVVRGGRPLQGEVRVSGAKNAALPVLAATLLVEDTCVLYDIPPLDDVETMTRLLQELGAHVDVAEGGALTVAAAGQLACEAPYDLVRRMRASILVLGPLLARNGRARAALPGGCAIGQRPIDLHLKGFAALGAEVNVSGGQVEVAARGRLRGASIYLDIPSVGATENIMMAAVLAEGTTTIENAAEEPEIVDLANFLNTLGADVRGAGTRVIQIHGVRELRGGTYTVIPDRIEAGTFMLAPLIAGGTVTVVGVVPEHVKSLTAKLREMGAEVVIDGDVITVSAAGRPRAVDVKTLPYPGFPTDLQAPMMAALATAEGTATVTETVFENRFMHVPELRRMGARIQIQGQTAIVTGVERLQGAPVTATDLRSGAALILAGLGAEGVTEVSGVHHIDRGYVTIEEKLRGLGADVARLTDQEDPVAVTLLSR